MSCHNMCTTISPPPGIERVLGLGFTFCLQKPRPEPDHEGSMDRFRRDTRLRELFQGQPDDDGSFIPKLHIRISSQNGNLVHATRTWNAASTISIKSYPSSTTPAKSDSNKPTLTKNKDI
mmetsp:Transcript_971/g.1517  ORF Transcript_971/g.1517 Transcript_971/m.1517 type:complete len:120 (+) Transcript_971:1103-1462(+)